MPTRTFSTKFYEYAQNNSGGFDKISEPHGLGKIVWVEATDPKAADARAESIGIYFDGCHNGTDCSCCGDRWYRAVNPCSSENPKSEPRHFEGPAYVHPLEGDFYQIPTN